MAHRADGARIRANCRHRRVHRVTREWTMARLTTDASVRVRLTNVGDVAVTIDACRLSGIHDWPGLIGSKRTCPVGPQPAVVARHKHRAESQEQYGPDGKQCREAKQVFVGAEWRHECSSDGRTLGNYGAAPSPPGFERYGAMATEVCELFSRPVENRAGYFFFKVLR